MRILVMGAGALGSVAGGFMAKHGHQVVLVGRTAHMNAISEKGLRVSGIWGNHQIQDLHSCTTIGQVSGKNFDLILIAVKSYDTAHAVECIAPRVGPDTLVCSYQNGLGNAETVAQAYGWERTVGARAIYGVTIQEPGHAKVTVIAQPTALGLFTDAGPAGKVQEIAKAMDAAGLPTVFTHQIATKIWAKVAYNCALNPLSALLDATYGELRDTPAAWEIMTHVIRELYTVANARGVPMDPPGAEAYIELFHDKLVPPTAAHYASMHADLKHRRRTEIDALNGAIAQFGKAANLPCPVNNNLVHLIKARETLASR